MRLPKLRSGPVCDFDRTVTPMVDVVFQLLVFFVLASGGRVAEHSLSTALSAGTVAASHPLPQPSPQTEPTTEIWLRLRHDPKTHKSTLRVNEGPIGDISQASHIVSALQKSNTTSSVILDVSGDVPWQDVIQIYDACRAAKFRAINFAAAPSELR